MSVKRTPGDARRQSINSHYIDGSVQDCSVSIANALEILQSCKAVLAIYVNDLNVYTSPWRGYLCMGDLIFQLGLLQVVFLVWFCHYLVTGLPFEIYSRLRICDSGWQVNHYSNVGSINSLAHQIRSLNNFTTSYWDWKNTTNQPRISI